MPVREFPHGVVGVPGRGVTERAAVGPTLLRDATGRPLPMHGLLAVAPIPEGGFVGVYSGDFVDTDDGLPKTTSYSMEGSGFVVTPRTVRGYVDPFVYPVAMINEPPAKTPANAAILEWSQAGDALPFHAPPRKRPCRMLAVHATRPIAAGEEIYMNYGSKYDRRRYPPGVAVGPASTLNKKAQIPLHERPRGYYEQRRQYLPPDAYELLFL